MCHCAFTTHFTHVSADSSYTLKIKVGSPEILLNFPEAKLRQYS
jgi:hypothetical protein